MRVVQQQLEQSNDERSVLSCMCDEHHGALQVGGHMYMNLQRQLSDCWHQQGHGCSLVPTECIIVV